MFLTTLKNIYTLHSKFWVLQAFRMKKKLKQLEWGGVFPLMAGTFSDIHGEI